MGTLYLKADANVEVQAAQVTIGELCSMECTAAHLLPKIKSCIVLKHLDQGKPAGRQQRHVVSMLRIIQLIHQRFPDLEIQNLGSADIIITYEAGKHPRPFWKGCKVFFVMLLTFVGAAFAIMAFNNDISTTKLFSQIYEQITGEQSNGFTVLEISYSIGIAVGILLFFNHFGKKRFTVDPTPMEVEMRTYENDIQTTLVEMASRKGLEKDVEDTSAGGHRA